MPRKPRRKPADIFLEAIESQTKAESFDHLTVDAALRAAGLTAVPMDSTTARAMVRARLDRWRSKVLHMPGTASGDPDVRTLSRLVALQFNLAEAWFDCGRLDMAAAVLSLVDLGNPEVTWRAAALLTVLTAMLKPPREP